MRRRARRTTYGRTSPVELGAALFAGLAMALAFIAVFALIGQDVARDYTTRVTYDAHMRAM